MACVNCGHDLVDVYCSRCGQRVRRSRLRIGPLLRQAADDALNLDQGLLHTVLALSRHPGRTIAEYVRGRTRPYTNPAKYLVIWAAVAAFTFLYSGLLDAQLELMGVAAVAEVDERQAAMNELLTRYFNLVLIAGVPFMAVFSRLFFRRAGYNFAEHLIFNVYVYAHQNLIFVVTLPAYFLQGDALLYIWFWLLLSVGYYVWACREFFEVSWITAAVRGLLATLCGFLSFWLLGGLVGALVVLAQRG